MKKIKLPSTEACRGERLGMPVFLVYLQRDETGLLSNLYIEKLNPFVRKGSAFSYNV